MGESFFGASSPLDSRLMRVLRLLRHRLSAWAADEDDYGALLRRVFRVTPDEQTTSLRQELVQGWLPDTSHPRDSRDSQPRCLPVG